MQIRKEQESSKRDLDNEPKRQSESNCIPGKYKPTIVYEPNRCVNLCLRVRTPEMCEPKGTKPEMCEPSSKVPIISDFWAVVKMLLVWFRKARMVHVRGESVTPQ